MTLATIPLICVFTEELNIGAMVLVLLLLKNNVPLVTASKSGSADPLLKDSSSSWVSLLLCDDVASAMALKLTDAHSVM